MGFVLPRVYPILDSSCIPQASRANFLSNLGRELASSGLSLLEYRNKPGTDADALADALLLRAALPEATLIFDDRVDVAMAAGFNGVHVDTGDLPVNIARRLMGAEAIIGTSASDELQLELAKESGGDYIAFGPVFPTTTKQTAATPIGIEGVQRFRKLAGSSQKLVAAGGITLETAPTILAAGADCVAVSAAIFRSADPAAEFRRWMEALGHRS
jgi:thiamine-phosphate pyrophosphorylase